MCINSTFLIVFERSIFRAKHNFQRKIHGLMVTASKERPHPCAADYIRSATTRARFKRYLVNYAREGWRKIRDKDKGLYNITFLFMS